MSVYEDLNIEELKYYYEFKGSIGEIDNLSLDEYIKYLIQEVEKGIQEAEQSINLANNLAVNKNNE